MDGSVNTVSGRTMDNAHNVQAANNMADTNGMDSTNEPEGMNRGKNYSMNNGSDNSWSPMGYVQMASKLMGLPVNNMQNEKLGKVENFMVDLSAGRIVAVIVSSGGFMGMDGELSAVPATKLSFNDAHDAFQLDASKEKLANSPHFKAGEWPDFNQPGYVGNVYGAYNAEPYFSTNAMGEPNNTARNIRDRDDDTMTPLDQGNDQADIDTTAQIRKDIMAADGMSMNAKNVKIITMNGHVTLRGPVNTDDEKSRIGDIANRVAQSGNVDNQLEVMIATSSNN
jgi:sporulation protein YlmC with PRC-barrel domain